MKDTLDCFLEELRANAVAEFQKTAHYHLLQEKLEQMERDCHTNLKPDQHAFVVECFDLLSDVDGQQEGYLYRKGFQDCVRLLKSLQVLG